MGTGLKLLCFEILFVGVKPYAHFQRQQQRIESFSNAIDAYLMLLRSRRTLRSTINPLSRFITNFLLYEDA